MDEPRSTAQNIVEHAQQISDAEKRRAYLEQACANDAALRQQVETLLGASKEGESCSDQALPTIAADPAPPKRVPDAGAFLPSFPLEEDIGSRIGPYKLLQKLGEGGMGIVFMAEQQEPVRRMVALKVIKAGMDSKQVVARFEAERQALALMDHPSIAKVLDVGATPSGRPAFVMELVKGIPITKYCEEQRLTLRERLELFVPVCQAIQHAHQKGILHRDIKPSNILVATYDGKPVPKVIDFGVAKAMGHKLTDHTLFTGIGVLVGTLEYMSPEQAEFNALDIDTRSDVYSLGVLLYELLTGTTPLTRQRVNESALTEILRLIREEEPPRPSTRLSELTRSGEMTRTGSTAGPSVPTSSRTSVSAQRHMEPADLSKTVQGEVDWIVMKCLEKDRRRRYETANALVRDIQRYLEEEPVEAGPPSATYRLRKMAWKYRRGLTMAAVLLVLLVAAAVVSTALAVWALRAEKEAVAERNRAWEAETKALKERNKAQEAVAEKEDAMTVQEFLLENVLNAGRPEGQDGGLGKNVTLRQAIDAAEARIAEKFKDRPLVEASVRFELATTYYYLGAYPQAIQQHQRALALREANLGADHPDTLLSRNDLAVVYRLVGRTTDAIRLFEQNLQQHEAKHGPSHIDAMTARLNLAQAYRDAGRINEAIRLQEQNLKLSEDHYKPDHSAAIVSRNGLARAYLSAGRVDEAIPLFDQALKQVERKFGVNHQDTLTFRNDLAEAYYAAGRLDEAIRLFEQILPQRINILPSDHPDTLQSRTNLALAYMRKEQFAKAEPLLRESLQIRQAKQPEEWKTFLTQSLLGAALLGQKKYTDAEPLLLQGYQGMKQREMKIPPQQQVRLREAVERLVKLYEATGKNEEAYKWRKELEQYPKAKSNDETKK